MNQQEIEQYNEAINTIKRINDEVYLKNMKAFLDEHSTKLFEKNDKLIQEIGSLKKSIQSIHFEIEDTGDSIEESIQAINEKTAEDLKSLVNELDDRFVKLASDQSSHTNDLINEIKNYSANLENRLEKFEQNLLSSINSSHFKLIDHQDKGLKNIEAISNQLLKVEQDLDDVKVQQADLINDNQLLKSQTKNNRLIFSIFGAVNLSALTAILIIIT